MPLRTLQLLGALLVLAALAVAPTVATGDTPPTAQSAGGGCNNNGPWSGWGNDWWSHDGNGGRNWDGWGDGNGHFNGNSDYGNCSQYGTVGGSAQAGKVARVEVAAKRLHGAGRCQNLSRTGHLSPVGSCARTHWMRADGTTNWSFHIPRALPSGRYRLHRRAVDNNGNRERTALLHLKIR
jgi:hypothetical protein